MVELYRAVNNETSNWWIVNFIQEDEVFYSDTFPNTMSVLDVVLYAYAKCLEFYDSFYE